MEIIRAMRMAKQPLSGTSLARQFHVSRQVIVQDVALLRAAEYVIYSTPKGYLLAQEEKQSPSRHADQTAPTRIFRVSHTDSEIETELQTIVDNGGTVLDVFVEHDVYGFLRAELNIQCRRHVQEFLSDIRSGKSSPLKNLTCGIHSHTVEADSEQTLDLIEAQLRQKGYLLPSAE